MANEAYEKSVRVNGGKYFFYKRPGKEWTGSFKKQRIYSRTFMPEGTEIKEAEDKATLLSILKTDKVPLKESYLDKETIAELDKAKVSYEKDISINPIDPDIKPIGTVGKGK